MDTTAQEQQPLRILVVEDDPDDARITFKALRRNPRFDPVHARSGAAALEATGTFALGLVDYRLPDMSGIELVRRLRARGLEAPLVILSAVQSDSIVARALEAGATDFLLKHLTYGERLAGELERFLGR
jgi:two-component system KDP operon response regulator KdpE